MLTRLQKVSATPTVWIRSGGGGIGVVRVVDRHDLDCSVAEAFFDGLQLLGGKSLDFVLRLLDWLTLHIFRFRGGI